MLTVLNTLNTYFKKRYKIGQTNKNERKEKERMRDGKKTTTEKICEKATRNDISRKDEKMI